MQRENLKILLLWGETVFAGHSFLSEASSITEANEVQARKALS